MTSARSRRYGRERASADPIARLMVDVALPHLDRPFDYAVSTELDEAVRAGSRVRVRFAGRLVDAFVLERRDSTDHEGALAFVERAVGEPVLTAETTRLFRAVADRYAGSFVDVVRLGVPPRHARAESARSADSNGQAATSAVGRSAVGPSAVGRSDPAWGRYRAGEAFLSAVREGRPARAVWSALPSEAWAARLAEAADAALSGGRGAIIVAPDLRDLARLDAAMGDLLGAGRHVALSADLGPAERYRRWLAVRRGEVRVVIGTRAAAFAPVAEVGLLAIWDDGDDLYAEQRAPYPNARDVLVLRSSLTGAALLVGGFARTAEAALLAESGWAHEIVADRPATRAAAARIVAAGDDVEQERDPGAVAARLPSVALRAAHDALQADRPVLVQVPRRGYVPSLACARDRTPARCATCGGPLAASSGHAIAACRWCGRLAGEWACPVCGGRRMRAVVVGSARTAEELGRAFPGVPVRTSGGDSVLVDVPGGASVVVATPGAEPAVDAGYGAALLLDGWALLARPDLRAAEEALRRWMNAAAMVAPDGRVVVGADASVPAVQALIRWDPAGFAARELAERRELGFPPAARMASLTGAPAAVAELIASADLPAQHEVIGPVPAGDSAERTLIRVPRAAGPALAEALKAAASARSARKSAEPVKLVLDPLDLF